MEVKIKKKGKTRKYRVIESWKEVTLEKWIKLTELEVNDKISITGSV